MEQNNTRNHLKTILVILLAAGILFLIYRTAVLSDEIEYLRGRISNLQADIQDVQANVREIYSNVDERLKKQASLLSGLEYSFGELDTDSHTAAVTLSVVPKNITDVMTLHLEFGGEKVAFVQDGNVFTAEFPVDIFARHEEFPLLTLSASSGVQTEYLEDVNLSGLYQMYLPELYVNIGHNFNLNGGKLYLDSHLHLDSKPMSALPEADFVSYELAAEVNGTEVSRQDLTGEVQADISAGGSYRTQLKMTLDAKVGDTVVFYLYARDSFGYIHKIQAFHWYEEDGAVAEPMSVDLDCIYDGNGNLLTRN